jgi:hypothetical protein
MCQSSEICLNARNHAGPVAALRVSRPRSRRVVYWRRGRALEGVRCTAPDGLSQWRYHGRLVARQLDDVHLVIRADFDYRDSVLRQFPGTFSVPTRYITHMMVVADLARGDAGAIEDALEAAWRLQRSTD